MNPQEQQQLNAISDALARLVRRQREFEERVARIETALALRAPQPPPAVERQPAPTPVAEPPVDPALRPLPAFLTQPPPAPPPRSEPTPEPERQLESVFGLTWR